MPARATAHVSAFVIVLALGSGALAFAALASCNTARYRGREGYDGACPTLVEYPCQPAPLGAPGCQREPDADAHGLFAQIPDDASYPNPCTLIIPVPVADEQGQCTIAGSCRCAQGEGIPDGGIGWICVESHY